MRILAITDLHANQRKSEQDPYYTSPTIYFEELAKRASQADLVVCAGDISVFGMELLDVLEAMNSWNKPVMLIHGNHEDPEMLEDVDKHYPNIKFIHGKEQQYNGVSVLGWGGGGFNTEDKHFAKFSQKLNPKHNRIMLIHSPPYGTTVDWMESWQEYRGNHTYREVIERLQPFLVVCGHIHENIGKQDRIGRTLVMNPGPLGILINLEEVVPKQAPKSVKTSEPSRKGHSKKK